MTTIQERYETIQHRIAEAAGRVDREPSEIHLVAVTKFASVDDVRQLVEIGHVDFGESRLQHFTQIAAQIDEYIDRRRELGEPDLTSPIRWHFIGHLQRNKCRRVIPLTRMVHSVDSLRLAEEIQEIACKKNVTVEVLLQANISRERQKNRYCPCSSWLSTRTARNNAQRNPKGHDVYGTRGRFSRGFAFSVSPVQ